MSLKLSLTQYLDSTSRWPQQTNNRSRLCSGVIVATRGRYSHRFISHLTTTDLFIYSSNYRGLFNGGLYIDKDRRVVLIYNEMHILLFK